LCLWRKKDKYQVCCLPSLISEISSVQLYRYSFDRPITFIIDKYHTDKQNLQSVVVVPLHTRSKVAISPVSKLMVSIPVHLCRAPRLLVSISCASPVGLAPVPEWEDARQVGGRS